MRCRDHSSVRTSAPACAHLEIASTGEPPACHTTHKSSPVKVLLKVADQYQIAHCAFATAAEINALAKWSRQSRNVRDPRAGDALEYAALTRKRWRTYLKMRRTATSVAALEAKIAADTDAEVAMLAVVKMSEGSRSPVLGFGLFRRTWRNHLIIDLLASNPFGFDRFGRVGVSLAYFIASIGETIGAKFIWGEATAGSAAFYEKTFGVPVDDLFRIEASVYLRFKARYLARWRKSGLPQL